MADMDTFTTPRKANEKTDAKSDEVEDTDNKDVCNADINSSMGHLLRRNTTNSSMGNKRDASGQDKDSPRSGGGGHTHDFSQGGECSGH